ncbi:MAG: DUF6062 family protein [Saccharofermentans sp.]|nr:DUF6062 family protein [Saccharofermentans sp.]
MEKIYMIPVNDAYSSDCDCPLCALSKKAEENELDYYLGPSLMEPDTRKITNKSGFCPEHLGKLNRREANRLGLGLMLHTHLKDVKEDISKDIESAIPSKASLFKGRSSDYKNKLIQAADKIDRRTMMCPICEKMNNAMTHYPDVITYMFLHDNDFKERFLNARSHCLPHTAVLLRAASRLSQNDAADFVSALYENNTKYFYPLIDDVEWFTLKFDYRNNDKPWGNSKNAIQRAMRFLAADRSDFDEKQSGNKK